MTVREKVIAYTGEPENIVDFNNNYHCCNCDGYDDHALAPTYYDGAKEEQDRKQHSFHRRFKGMRQGHE